MHERSYWLGFSQCPGIGPTRFAKLLSHFSTAKNAWEATEHDLKNILGESQTEKLLDFKKSFSFEDYEARLQKAAVSYVTLSDKDYPSLLKQIKNPPVVLFFKGDITAGEYSPVGIVGTRKITEYGRQVTELVTYELVEKGCSIISGLALGVDTIAHQTTIDHGGQTIAVLGCGVDCCYPRENEMLYQKILEKNGAVVSEYGLGQPPTIGSFPSRNRIIAGLSLGVVVTEGAADSGALITAKDAKENGRNVFAVPGPVTSSLSVGPYQLIKDGATIVASAKEIMTELGLTQKQVNKTRKIIKGDTEQEQTILDLLAMEQLHFDELVKRTQIDSSNIGSLLSLMEMKGMIKSYDGGFFSLTQ